MTIGHGSDDGGRPDEISATRASPLRVRDLDPSGIGTASPRRSGESVSRPSRDSGSPLTRRDAESKFGGYTSASGRSRDRAAKTSDPAPTNILEIAESKRRERVHEA
jgi:hypothetical protein